jgi:hypothetical protein
MAPQKKFPTETETQQLEQEGFSQEQIAGLIALKALYTKGIYDEVDPERERREFIRWLYLQGRLQS